MSDSGERSTAEDTPARVPEPAGLGPVPRFAGPAATFGRLPAANGDEPADVAVLGIPFDAGTTYRPGARFGPSAIRESSRLLRPYHAGLDVRPFDAHRVVDAGDVACTPFDIDQAIAQIEEAVGAWVERGTRLLALGGDHTISLPLLRRTVARTGPVALVHFDAHLDTWDTYFGAAYTHGTPFRRAAEEGLFLDDRSMHVGIRGPLYGPHDLADDERMGFRIVDCMTAGEVGPSEVARRIRERAGDAPIYLSIDIDVLDPAFAPATGTPEAGGLSSRELLAILRGLAGSPLAGADVVEVSPAYDHAEITAIAAAHVAYEILALMAFSSALGESQTRA